MKNGILKIISVCIVIIMAVQTNMVMAAQTTTELENEKQDNKNQINETEKKKQEVEDEKNETIKEVENITNQIENYESQISELENKIDELNNKIQTSEQKIKEKEEDYNKQQELLNARLVAIYEEGEVSYLDVLLSSKSIADLISKYYLVTELATYDTELMETIQKQKEEIQTEKQGLEESKKELATSKASKQSVTMQLQTAKGEKNEQVAKLSEDEKKLQSQIDELKEANKSIDQEIAAARAKIAAQKKAEEEKRKQQQAANNANQAGTSNSSGSSNQGTGSSSSGSSLGGSSSSGFIRPVNSYITTGMHYSSGQYHGAVDFGAAGINGAPVYAVADGYVVTAKAMTSSYGNYIIIEHDNGLFTLYAHGQAGSIAVSPYQRVKQGQQIMRVGSTGNSSGPHLHFEVRTSPGGYANRVDPRNYLP